MNVKRWLSVILMAGLVVALSAPSALAWNNRSFGRHHPNFRGGVPHGRAYGYHGQRPAWNHGKAYGWHHRNQWNQRGPHGAYYQGPGGNQNYGRFHNPNLGRAYGPHYPYSNAGYRFGPHN